MTNTEEEINTTGISPLGFNVLLDMPKPSEKTKGGILLTDAMLATKSLMNNIGQIIAMGSDAFLDVYGKVIPDKPKVGDFVYINQHAGRDIHLSDGRLLRMVSSDEIRAVVDKAVINKLSNQ